MDIKFEITDGIALIQLDDGKKNAVTMDAAQEILAAVEKSQADANALVIAGRPGAFCAGFDMAVMTGSDQAAMMALGKLGGRIVHALYSTRQPTVAACTGHAFTVGALWLLASDTRFGEAGDFKLGMTETAVGVPLAPWSMEPLKARLSPTHFVPVVAQSQILNPESAVAAGFLDVVVPAGEAIDHAMKAAAELAQLPAKAYGINKLMARQAALDIMAADLAA